MAVVKTRKNWQLKYPAFKWCADLGEGWYLPAIEELKLFTLDHPLRRQINRILLVKGDEISTYHSYWSSSERGVRYKYHRNLPWCVDMHMGDTEVGYEFCDYYVRAVSAF